MRALRRAGDASARRRRDAALSGVLAAAVALAVAELVAGLIGRTSSPVVAVGGAFIDRTPTWLKDVAVTTFGGRDKDVLLGGILLTVALLAALVGVLAVTRRRLGYLAIAALGAVTALAALSRPESSALDALPSLVGAAAGMLALGRLVDALDPPEGSTAASRAGLDRRQFLRTAVVTGGAAAVTGVLGRAALASRLDASASRAAVDLPPPANPAPSLPAASLAVPGITPLVTRNNDFYRVDTELIVPQVTAESWRLRIHGMVDRELKLTFPDLLSRPLIERDITLTCVSNEVGGDLAGSARWLGAPLKDLLDDVGVHPGATSLVSRSVDGMTIGTPVDIVTDGRDAMLAVGMNGEPLPVAHGFPVRMVVPGLYGYVSACKWLVDLELTTFENVEAYWVERGWAAQGPIRTASRIDTPSGGAQLRPGRVVVAGVAWAQHRGIRRVEVRVDAGQWHEASLAATVGPDVWRQWSWTWDPAEPGTHTLEVRATDATGAVQTPRRTPPFPQGATGWHSVSVRIRG